MHPFERLVIINYLSSLVISFERHPAFRLHHLYISLVAACSVFFSELAEEFIVPANAPIYSR